MSPIYTPGKLILRRTYIGLDDPDAAAYITAVEIADGQPLEIEVQVAIHTFVKGCKADGIWPAIKASCIMAGARTLAGALVPLVGPAPTNFNFVSGDYNRKTGLVGDGSTKYLNSNRNNNADPQNSKHVAVFSTQSETRNATRSAISSRSSSASTGSTHVLTTIAAAVARVNTAATSSVANTTPFTGLFGGSRFSNTQVSMRFNNASTVIDESSSAPAAVAIDVFSRNGGDFSNARLAFYSIGESLDLALLDARITTLINAVAAAIP
jgi:hypothetical protein